MGTHVDPWEPRDEHPYDCGYEPAVWPLIVALVVVVVLGIALITGAVA